MPTKADAASAQIQRKTAVIDEIRERLDAADAAVLTEYRGLTVTAIAELRAALRPAATDYKIFKNTLARRAAEGTAIGEIADQLVGPVAIAFVRKDGGDAVTAAKALRDFARTNPNLVVKGGVLGPRLLTTKDVEALAEVPPRDELLARLAGGFQAPLTKAAGLFQAFTRNFAYGLKAYIDTRPADAAAPAAESVAPAAEPTESPSTEGESEGATAPSAEESQDAPAADEAATPSGESDKEN
jgi:large subunit ribosomal protein L10